MTEEQRWQFKDHFRIGVERDPTARFWRRYRWSVERSTSSAAIKWRWMGSGRAWSARGAWRVAHRRVFWHDWPWDRTERIEQVIVRQHSCAPVPDRPKWADEPVGLEMLGDERARRGT